MGRFIKPGRVVILLAGRYAGKKAVVIRCYDDGAKERSFAHCLVAGIEKAPLRVKADMSEKKQDRRLRAKPFVKYVNYQHIMPTRYLVTNETIDMKSIVNEEDMGSVDSRKKIKTALRNLFLEKWKRRAAIRGERGAIAHVEFLFTKLRF